MKALLPLVVLQLMSSSPVLCVRKVKRQGDYWAPWGEWGECSRTCGSGITTRSRLCYSSRTDGGTSCVGPTRNFRSCNIQDCSEGSRDFREEQCSQYDGTEFQGKRYKWLPYYGAPNKCELNCIPKGENFYFRHREAVVDGTPCEPGKRHVCVEGVCKPLGCDNMLESPQKEDQCLECGGDGRSCYPVKGTFEVADLPKGYNQMFIIPVGATSIRIREVVPTRNFLAIKNVRGEYYLNGHWVIDFPRAAHIGSTVLHYERGAEGDLAPETIHGRGPTTEPLVIELIRQEPNQGVEYEYYLPYRSQSQGYVWGYGSWAECSKECGAGYQSRLVFCTIDNEAYSDYLCASRPRPVSNRTCNLQPCPQTKRMAYLYQAQVWMRTEHLSSRVYSWKMGEWSACSATCDGGTQTRSVFCLTQDSAGSRVADESQCAAFSARPHSQQACSLRHCAAWSARGWSECSETCGEGEQTRSVVCLSGAGIQLQDYACQALPKPASTQPCERATCPREISWHIGDWGLCSKSCDSGLRERQVICADRDRNFYNLNQCVARDRPSTVEKCNTQPCSVRQEVPSMPDPRGYDETRRGTLVPYIPDGPSTVYRNTERRESEAPPPPVNREEGSNPPQYHWEFHGQVCTLSQYGCCPDGYTRARGPQGWGCPGSSCAQSRYGCCPDGITAALGPNNAGCHRYYSDRESRPSANPNPNPSTDNTEVRSPAPASPDGACRTSTYGCCYDGVILATGPNGEGCHSRPHYPHPVACLLPYATGPCSEWAGRWYFVPSSGACSQFWYGGCHGNRNSFLSEQECLSECKGQADVQPVSGGGQDVQAQTLQLEKEDSRGDRRPHSPGKEILRGDNWRKPLAETDSSTGSQSQSQSVQKVFTIYHGTGPRLTIEKRPSGHTPPSPAGEISSHGGKASSSRSPFHSGQAQPVEVSERGGYDRHAQARAHFVKGQHRSIHGGGPTLHTTYPGKRDQGPGKFINSRWTSLGQGGVKNHELPDKGYHADTGSPQLPPEAAETPKPAPAMKEEAGEGGDSAGLDTPGPVFQSPDGLVSEQSSRLAAQSSQHSSQRLSIDKSGPSTVEGRPGQTVRLPCKVPPSPGVTVEWRRDGRPLSSPRHLQQPDGSMLIGPLSARDSGWLMCVASNSRERDHRYILLTVAEDARSPVPPQEDHSIQQGGGGFVSGHPIETGPQSTPSQTLHPVPWPAHHSTHRLSIDKSGPSTVEGRPGQTVRLPCKLPPSPGVTVEWRRDGRPLSSPRHTHQADGSLIISELSSEDPGHYTCIASNARERDHRQLQLKVQGDLKITTAPNNVQVSEGSSTQLPCIVTGSNVNVRWSRNGVPVRSDGRHVLISQDGSLILNNVQRVDEGSYTCNAYTGSHSVSASAEVRVIKNTPQAPPSRSSSAECIDQPELANCDLIVYAKLCSNEYYSSFCCASCSRHTEQG
ncbi:papilin-like isoform X1 [Acipenser ruthenus]|uniref:papilin-like isoform X1 n=1 Tax=Acipenser ruthenus TaxID=7906 RepID=UPI0027410483|nr:papilin-like isoform X1 [Acipenser ruthenus]